MKITIHIGMENGKHRENMKLSYMVHFMWVVDKDIYRMESITPCYLKLKN
jgi:hypothetical protein